MRDLENLSNTIKYIYKSPVTAVKYLRELKKVISRLAENADIYQLQTSPALQQYGKNVRRVNYKKMTIIYTLQNKVVFIHRVAPQSLITEL